MAAFSIFTSILKLLVICSSSNHKLMALQVLTMLQLVNGMEIIPLWNETNTGVNQPCIIDNSTADKGLVSFQSSSHNICSLQINSSSEHHIFIEISSSISDEDFLYIERLDSGSYCPYRYVAIEGFEECSASFIYNNIQVNSKTNTTLSIIEIQANETTRECPELNQIMSLENEVGPPCTAVKGYDNITMCRLQDGYYFETEVDMCWFSFPTNCNVTIGKNEAILECPETSRILLLYPDPFIALRFSSNRIVHIDTHAFDKLPNLEILKLSSAKLVTLQPGVFERLNKLRLLSLSYNRFTTLDEEIFKGLTNLTDLLISANRLNKLPARLLHDLVNLEKLKLVHNMLTTLNETFFQGLNRLKVLRLGYNKLSYLPIGLFDGLHNLEELWIGRNQLVTFDSEHFRDLKNLKILSARYNELRDVPNDLGQRLKKLRVLDLSNNKMSFLDKHTFQGFVQADTLRLSNNLLSEVHVDLFQNLESLRILLLSGNNLTKLDAHIFKSLPNLERLHIGTNQLHNISNDFFANMSKLKLLKINVNKLTDLDANIFTNLVNLNHLNIGSNLLHTIPDLRKSTGLSHFIVSHNPITTVNREFLSSLTNETNVLVSQHEICECYVPKVAERCKASEERSPYLTCTRLLSDRILVVAMWLIGLNAFVGNLFVLIWKQQKHKSHVNWVQSMLLSNLAMSDFLMGVYMIMIASADIYFGESFPLRAEQWRSGITCRVAGTLSILSSEASVLFVTLISIDRFINIKFPYSTRKLQKRSTIITVVLSWCCALTLSVVPSVLAGKNFKFYDNSHVCIGLPLALTQTYTTHKAGLIEFEETSFRSSNGTFYEQNGYEVGLFYSSALFLGFNALCFLLILGCYIEIILTVQTSAKQSGRSQDMNEQIRMTTKVAAIVATDFFCWAPVIFLGILVQTRVIKLGPSVYAWLVTCVVPINSAINPYLYTIAELISQCRKRKQETFSDVTRLQRFDSDSNHNFATPVSTHAKELQ